MLEIVRVARERGLQADLFVRRVWQKSIEYEAGLFKGYTVKEHEGSGLRIIRPDGRMGFYAFSSFKNPHEVVEKALEVSEFGDTVEFSIPSYPPKIGWKDFTDSRLEELTVRDMVELGEYFVEQLKTSHPEVMVNVELVVGREERSLYNHHEEELHFSRTFFQLSVEANKVTEGDILSVYGERSWGNRDIDIEELLKEIRLKLDFSEQVIFIKGGKYPVLFTPSGCVVLLYPLLYGLNGRNIAFGKSPLQDKMGKVLFSSLFSLFEVPQEPWTVGSCPFDDEGMLTPEERILVDRGRVEEGFWDLWSAAKAKHEATASGFRRSPWDVPEPRFSVLKVKNGLRDRETLVEEIEEGLVVDSLLGVGQSNIASGVFSCGVQLGFYVKGGEIQGRVKNVMVSGNAYQALKDIKEISRDCQWVQGSILIPYLLVEPVEVHVTGEK